MKFKFDANDSEQLPAAIAASASEGLDEDQLKELLVCDCRIPTPEEDPEWWIPPGEIGGPDLERTVVSRITRSTNWILNMSDWMSYRKAPINLLFDEPDFDVLKSLHTSWIVPGMFKPKSKFIELKQPYLMPMGPMIRSWNLYNGIHTACNINMVFKVSLWFSIKVTVTNTGPGNEPEIDVEVIKMGFEGEAVPLNKAPEITGESAVYEWGIRLSYESDNLYKAILGVRDALEDLMGNFKDAYLASSIKSSAIVSVALKQALLSADESYLKVAHKYVPIETDHQEIVNCQEVPRWMFIPKDTPGLKIPGSIVTYDSKEYIAIGIEHLNGELRTLLKTLNVEARQDIIVEFVKQPYNDKFYHYTSDNMTNREMRYLIDFKPSILQPRDMGTPLTTLSTNRVATGRKVVEGRRVTQYKTEVKANTTVYTKVASARLKHQKSKTDIRTITIGNLKSSKSSRLSADISINNWSETLEHRPIIKACGSGDWNPGDFRGLSFEGDSDRFDIESGYLSLVYDFETRTGYDKQLYTYMCSIAIKPCFKVDNKYPKDLIKEALPPGLPDDIHLEYKEVCYDGRYFEVCVIDTQNDKHIVNNIIPMICLYTVTKLAQIVPKKVAVAHNGVGFDNKILDSVVASLKHSRLIFEDSIIIDRKLTMSYSINMYELGMKIQGVVPNIDLEGPDDPGTKNLRLNLRDSYTIVQKSLSEFTKTYAKDFAKTDIDLKDYFSKFYHPFVDHPNNVYLNDPRRFKIVRDYCMQDSISLIVALYNFTNMYLDLCKELFIGTNKDWCESGIDGMNLVSSSSLPQALLYKVCRVFCYELPMNIIQWFRTNAYYGGYCNVLPGVELGAVYHNVNGIDIKSAYPTIMEKPIPSIFVGMYTTEPAPTETGWVLIKVYRTRTDVVPMLVKGINGRLVFGHVDPDVERQNEYKPYIPDVKRPNDYRLEPDEYLITTDEYRYFKNIGYLIEYEFVSFFKFRTTKSFSKLINKLFELKEKYKREKDPVKSSIIKVSINSLYGIMGQNKESLMPVKIADKVFIPDNETELYGYKYINIIRDDNRIALHVAAWCTAITRLRLYKSCNGLNRVGCHALYTDTDSIYYQDTTTVPPRKFKELVAQSRGSNDVIVKEFIDDIDMYTPEPDPDTGEVSELGTWDLEHYNGKICIWWCKQYAIESNDFFKKQLGDEAKQQTCKQTLDTPSINTKNNNVRTILINKTAVAAAVVVLAMTLGTRLKVVSGGYANILPITIERYSVPEYLQKFKQKETKFVWRYTELDHKTKLPVVEHIKKNFNINSLIEDSSKLLVRNGVVGNIIIPGSSIRRSHQAPSELP